MVRYRAGIAHSNAGLPACDTAGNASSGRLCRLRSGTLDEAVDLK